MVDPKRWYQLNNTSNGLDGLFDGNTQVNVQTGWGKVLGEYDAYYPLKDDEQLTLNAIKFFDFEGMAPDHPMTLSVINDQWQRIEIASFKDTNTEAGLGLIRIVSYQEMLSICWMHLLVISVISS